MKLMSISELKMAVQSSGGIEKIILLTRLGRSQLGRDFARAEALAEEALALCKEFEDATAYSLTLNLLSDCKFTRGQFNEGIVLSEEALELQLIIGDTDMLARTYSQIGNNSLRLNKFDDSIDYYKNALKIHKSDKNEAAAAMIYGNLALVHQQLGDLDKALKLTEKSQRINNRIGNTRELSRNLANKGAIYYSQGYLTKSVKTHLKSLKYKELNKDKEGMAHSLGSIGICLSQQNQNDDALEYLKKALKISRELDSGYYIAHYLVDIGILYRKQGKYKKSLEYNLEALEISRSGGMISNEIHTLQQIADLYKFTKEFDKGLHFGKQALELAIKHDDVGQIPVLYNVIAEVHLKSNNYKQAKASALEALKCATNIKLKPQIAHAHDLMSKVSKKIENWEEAFYHHEKYSEIQAEFLEGQQNEKLGHLRTQYETEKAERETEIYRLKNVKLAKKNKKISEQRAALKQSEQEFRELAEKLSESNGMKDLFLDIITHDLKNPAGVIYSMSQMVEEDYPGIDEIGIIKSSSERLLQVLEHANSLSKVSSEEAIHKERLHLKTIIQSVVTDFSSQLQLNKMTCSMDISEEIQIQANPLIREVFDNYLSNAIKYASSGKQIEFKAKHVGGEILISVNDLGELIAQENRDLVFKRTTQLAEGKKHGRGLGLAIVKKIASAHGGKCWVEPNTPRGNSFYLSLPLE